MHQKEYCLALLLTSGMLLLTACSPAPVNSSQLTITDSMPLSSNSRNSLDWAGSYQGVLPCASCEGIATTLTLTADSQFQLQSIYLGKETEKTVNEMGPFSWDSRGSKIKLESDSGETRWFRVEENAVRLLDQQGEMITGDLAEQYRLALFIPEQAAVEVENTVSLALVDRDWHLSELLGQTMAADSGAYIHFSHDGKVWGSSGCNRFSGSWQGSAYQLSLGQLASTMMACTEDKMAQEQLLLAQLALADNYTLVEDTLSLNKARMSTLARFTIKASAE